MTSRREFLIGGLSAGAAAPLAGLSLAPAWLPAAGRSLKKLVVIQIRGGWDYVNMFPACNHPNYIAARPNLRIAQANALQVQAGLDYFWHPALLSLKDLFDRGDLAVVHNIGYPTPNLSHFESEKKWYAADPSASVLQSGWLSRYLTQGYSGTFEFPALDLETGLSPAFSGSRVPVLNNLDSYVFQYDRGTPNDNLVQAAALQANAMLLRAPGTNLQVAASGIVNAINSSQLLTTVGSAYQPRATYPNTALANSLRLAARYIAYDLPTEMYYTSTGGFDTHANEAVLGAPHTGNFANLLAGFADALKAFLDDMAAYGKGDDVVVMVFSEFSRRFGENGSLGCEHGHGGVAFLAGGAVNGGLYGNYPDLNAAVTPYTTYYFPFNALSTDFRSLYATVLERVLGTPHAPILGGTFPLLGAL